jgi:hypothetical protein
MSNLSIILGALLGISEALSLIPALKSGGILDFIINLLKNLEGAQPK